MNHTHVQLIFLAADTTPNLPPTRPLRSSTEEAERQARHLVNVIKDASEGSGLGKQVVDARDSTLKVFMAPEFFFRRPAGTPDGEGHFTRTDFMRIRGTLSAELSKFLTNQQWIVVPGSVIWRVEQEGSLPQLLLNSIYLLDFTAAERRDVTCDKKYFSALDGLPIPANAASPWNERPPAAGYLSSQSLIVRGRKIGMEICLDHGAGVLRSSTEPKGGAPRPPMALHLIVACGMDLLATNCAASQTGLVLRCNGNAYNAVSPYDSRQDPSDHTIRSDVYRWSPLVQRWSRDPDVRTSQNFRYLPYDLQRPWLQLPKRFDGAPTFDGIGFSPSFAFGT